MESYKVISLGWGIQSWTIAVMVALGYLPKVDIAIHADTTHEHEATYEFAAKWTQWLIDRGVNVVTVKNTMYGKTDVFPKPHQPIIPAHSYYDGKNIRQLKRQCTKAWKIDPIKRYVKRQRKLDKKNQKASTGRNLDRDYNGRMASG